MNDYIQTLINDRSSGRRSKLRVFNEPWAGLFFTFLRSFDAMDTMLEEITFELDISCFGCNLYTNCATTIAPKLIISII